MGGMAIRNRNKLGTSLAFDKKKSRKGKVEFYSPDKDNWESGEIQSGLDRVLAMGMDAGDDVAFANESGTPYPYLQYDPSCGGDEKRRDLIRIGRPKTGK